MTETHSRRTHLWTSVARRIRCLALLLAMPAFASADETAPATAPAERVFRAGAAMSNITPPLGELIVGGFEPYPARHVHDELHARCLVLDDGRTIEAENVLSSAGHVETLALLRRSPHEVETLHSREGEAPAEPRGTTSVEYLSGSAGTSPSRLGEPPSRRGISGGEISFNEMILILDCQPRELGHDRTIVFYNDADRFHYELPAEPLDMRSGIICTPNNFCYAGGRQLGTDVWTPR